MVRLVVIVSISKAVMSQVYHYQTTRPVIQSIIGPFPIHQT